MNDKFGGEWTWSNRGSIAPEVRTRTYRIQAAMLTATPKCCARSDVTKAVGSFRMTLLTSNRRQFWNKMAASTWVLISP